MFGRKARRIKSLEQKLATRDGIIDEKCLEIYELGQANTNLDERNARLRAQNKDLRESNLRLLNDANQMRQRLPHLAELQADQGVSGRVDVAGLRMPDLTEDERAAFVEAWRVAVDEDVTRPYIPDYEDREQPWTEER